MTTDTPPTCRPCGRRGKVRLATWVRNDETVQNWYMCDQHAELVSKISRFAPGIVTQLPNAAEARRKNKEAEARATNNEH